MREMLSNLTEDMFKKGLVVLFLLSFESKKAEPQWWCSGESLTSVFGSRSVSYIHDGLLPGKHAQAFSKTLST